MTDIHTITTPSPIRVQEQPTWLTREQIHTEAEKIRAERQERRRLALRLVSLGRVLEKLKSFSPGQVPIQGLGVQRPGAIR